MGCARFFSLRLCGFLLVGLAGSLMSLSLQGEPARVRPRMRKPI